MTGIQAAAGLIAAGLPAETPAAVVSRGTLPDQEVVTGPLSELPSVAADLPGPALVVVGEVVALAASLAPLATLSA